MLKVVLNVPNVMLVKQGLVRMARMVPGVKCAVRVNIVRAVWMLFVVKIVPLDSVKVMKDKLCVSHVAPANSTMLLVLVPVNYVSTRLTLMEKQETVVALNARLDGRPKTAVLNVPRAVRGRTVLVVKCVVRVNIVRAA